VNAIRGSDNAGNWMSDITPGQMKSLDGFIDTALARLDLEKNVKFITGHSLGGLCTVHAIDKRPNAKGIFFNAYKNDSRSRIESYRIKGDPAGVAGGATTKLITPRFANAGRLAALIQMYYHSIDTVIVQLENGIDGESWEDLAKGRLKIGENHVLKKPLGTSKTAERVSKIGKNHFLRKPFGSTNFKRPSC
jgi:hypothetical protein